MKVAGVMDTLVKVINGQELQTLNFFPVLFVRDDQNVSAGKIVLRDTSLPY